MFHLLHPDIGVPLHEDLVIEVRGELNLLYESPLARCHRFWCGHLETSCRRGVMEFSRRWCSQRVSFLNPGSGAHLRGESVFAVRQEPNFPPSTIETSLVECGRFLTLPRVFLEVVKVAERFESNEHFVIGLCFHKSNRVAWKIVYPACVSRPWRSIA